MAVPVTESTSDRDLITKSEREVVSTHVLVEQEKVEKLRELSKRTRIAQSEYLREAVDDLLSKYDRKPEDD
ncbi:MAG: ribbon-helix-helix domain-containing protein [Myxococcaceae bacterium]